MKTLKNILISTLLIVLAFGISMAMFADTNEYEQKLVGKWENEYEANIIVFEKDNVCYIMDSDGVRQSRNGRWSATSSKVSMELRYNRKNYRSVFKYEIVKEKDDKAQEVKFELVKSLVNGKEDKSIYRGEDEFILKRWEE